MPNPTLPVPVAGDDGKAFVYDDAATAIIWGTVASGGTGGDTYTNHGNQASTLDIDWSAATIHRLVLTGNVTLTFSGAPSSGTPLSGMIIIVHDNTTNVRTVTWPGSVLWPLNELPYVPDDVADALSLLTFVTVDGGTTYLGALSGNWLP